jgi:hypothetical protein
MGGVLAWAAVSGFRGGPRARATRLSHPRLVKRVLIIAAAPTAATIAAAWVGGWDAGNVVRAAAAVPLGATIAAVITAVAAGDLR